MVVLWRGIRRSYWSELFHSHRFFIYKAFIHGAKTSFSESAATTWHGPVVKVTSNLHQFFVCEAVETCRKTGTFSSVVEPYCCHLVDIINKSQFNGGRFRELCVQKNNNKTHTHTFKEHFIKHKVPPPCLSWLLSFGEVCRGWTGMTGDISCVAFISSGVVGNSQCVAAEGRICVSSEPTTPTVSAFKKMRLDL